jgi:hypothetical protein
MKCPPQTNFFFWGGGTVINKNGSPPTMVTGETNVDLSIFSKNTPSPPKKVNFLGGASFLQYFHEFLELGNIKTFW